MVVITDYVRITQIVKHAIFFQDSNGKCRDSNNNPKVKLGGKYFRKLHGVECYEYIKRK